MSDSCVGRGRPVAIEAWRSYLYCPVCRRRFNAGRLQHARHPNPRYTQVIIPAHQAKA